MLAYLCHKLYYDRTYLARFQWVSYLCLSKNITSKNSPGRLYTNSASKVQLPSLSREKISPNARLKYQSSHILKGSSSEIPSVHSLGERSRCMTLKGFNLSMAKLYDDVDQSSVQQPRRHSILTTSLANVAESGHDNLSKPAGMTTLALSRDNRLGEGSRANPILSDSRMRYSDICDSHSCKSSGVGSSDRVTPLSALSALPNELTVSQTPPRDIGHEASGDKHAYGTFLTGLEGVSMPSLTEAVITRPDLITIEALHESKPRPVDPILTNQPLILPIYAKKTDFSPPFTMMPRSPILKMVIDKRRTKSLLERGLMPTYGDLTEEDIRLVKEQDIEQHLMSPRASEFIKHAYKNAKAPLDNRSRCNISPEIQTPNTWEKQPNANDSTEEFIVHLYKDACGFYSTYPHHIPARKWHQTLLHSRRVSWNGALTPSTRDKEYLKMMTLRPPESHYRHEYKRERIPIGLTFEQMLKYAPQTEVEYNIFNVYRWRPTWYDLKGWGDPHPPPTISDSAPYPIHVPK